MPYLREMTDEEQAAIAAKLRELADMVDREKPREFEMNLANKPPMGIPDGVHLKLVARPGLQSAEIRIEWPS